MYLQISIGFVLMVSSFFMAPVTSTNNCKHQVLSKMMSASCSKLFLKKVPIDLMTSIQVLDISHNKLRELKEDSLSRYTSLQYLDMSYDDISVIEDTAFNTLKDLKVWDLSRNSLSTLPNSLFTLPSLRELYLQDNRFTTLIYTVTSPLVLLQLAENRKLIEFPRLGPLPDLTNLNVSYTAITNISVEDVAQFCSLETLDITHTDLKSSNYLDECNCPSIVSWVKLYKINASFPYSTKSCSQCPNATFPDAAVSARNECNAMIEVRIAEAKVRVLWIIIFCLIVTSAIIVFVVLYCIHKKIDALRKKVESSQSSKNESSYL